jgi:hypothetical protein
VKRLLILIGFIGIATISQAQKAKLTGKITSTKNEALASVSLTLQSDKTQVSKTDIEGIDINEKQDVVNQLNAYDNQLRNVNAQAFAQQKAEQDAREKCAHDALPPTIRNAMARTNTTQLMMRNARIYVTAT